MKMILTPEEAKQGVCKLQQPMMRPGPPRELPCLADKCMTYWRWVDAEHTKGYCSITGKPEF
jgi:hypothetical protein